MCLQLSSAVFFLAAVCAIIVQESEADNSYEYVKAMIGKKLAVTDYNQFMVMSANPSTDGKTEVQLFGDSHAKGQVSVLMMIQFEFDHGTKTQGGHCLISNNGDVVTTDATLCGTLSTAMLEVSKGKDTLEKAIQAAKNLAAGAAYTVKSGDATTKKVGLKLNQAKKLKIGAVDWDVSGAVSLEPSKLKLDGNAPHRMLFVAKHPFSDKHASILVVAHFTAQGEAQVDKVLYAEGGKEKNAPADPALASDEAFKPKIVEGLNALKA